MFHNSLTRNQFHTKLAKKIKELFYDLSKRLPKHVVDLSIYVKTWLQESIFLNLVCFVSVDIIYQKEYNCLIKVTFDLQKLGKNSCFGNVLPVDPNCLERRKRRCKNKIKKPYQEQYRSC